MQAHGDFDRSVLDIAAKELCASRYKRGVKSGAALKTAEELLVMQLARLKKQTDYLYAIDSLAQQLEMEDIRTLALWEAERLHELSGLVTQKLWELRARGAAWTV